MKDVVSTIVCVARHILWTHYGYQLFALNINNVSVRAGSLYFSIRYYDLVLLKSRYYNISIRHSAYA